ncbi:gas vesicle protein [Fontibacillus phaseoli]|uniref:Gas vesicle protein n=1 Tax=Fontibacillus phaseoli TaxID=1416533 RepID=A0A369BMB9_9BACL|nr:YtxH domain-containing protein [Fontibacillus phaseoli]RCX21768.1 gas vesicle protein [Fontibacillus phaseoli]
MGKGNKGWIWGAAIGTIVGSVTALLFAPKPGRELRKDIADGARQVGEKTQEVAGKVSEQSSQLAGKVKETAEGLVNDFQAWRGAKGNTEADDKEVLISSFGEEEASAPEETAVIGVAEETALEAAPAEKSDAGSPSAEDIVPAADTDTEEKL